MAKTDVAGETPTSTATATPPSPRLDDIIETWFREHFHREPIATNTQHFNFVRTAVDNLKRRLSTEG